MDEPVKILLFENNPAETFQMMGMLSGLTNPSVDVEFTDQASAAAEKAADGKIAAVLIDIASPDTRGLEIFTKFHAKAPNASAVLIVNSKDEKLGLEAMGQGAVDYLIKEQLDNKSLTRSLRLAVERHKLQAKLDQKDKELLNLKETKNEFISMVSHELRTPLTIMKEFISIILEEIPGKINKAQKEYLSITQKNIGRLAVIIDDLLDLSRIESGKMRLSHSLVSLSYLVKSTLESFEPEAKNKKIDLGFSHPGELPKVFVDPDRITQVLTNLAGNIITTETTYSNSPANSLHVKVNASTLGPYLTKAFTPGAPRYFRFYIYLPITFGNDMVPTFIYSATNRRIILFLNASGDLTIEGDGDWSGVYHAVVLTKGAWHRIEIMAPIPSAAAVVRWWVNGMELPSLTDDFSDAGSTWNSLRFGLVSTVGTGITEEIYLDDFAVSDSPIGP